MSEATRQEYSNDPDTEMNKAIRTERDDWPDSTKTSPDWCKLQRSMCVRIKIRTFGARRRQNLENKFQCGRFARNAEDKNYA